MAKTVQVQDGNLVFESVDQNITVDVQGQVFIGRDTANDIITTSNNANLIISTGGGAHMILSTLSAPNGILEINNIQWPDNFGEMVHGALMFVEYDANDQQFKLRYHRLVMGTVESDSLTQAEMNQRFPGAHNGNMVIGPSSIYVCLGDGEWASRSGTGGSGGGGGGGGSIIGNVSSDNLSAGDLNSQFPLAAPGDFTVGPTVTYMKVSATDWRRQGYPVGDPLVLSQIPYDLIFSFYESSSGVTIYQDAIIGGVLMARPVMLEAGLAGSIARLETPPLSGPMTIWIIRKTASGAESTIGTLDFAMGSTDGVFTFSQNVTFQTGDRIKLYVPNQGNFTDASGLTATIVGWLPVV